MSFRTPPNTIGSYQLERQIGQGAHASVWLAQHHSLPEHLVAIKVHPHTPSSGDAPCQREATWLSKCPNPHIPRLYDYGSTDAFDYIVMQYIPGTSLRQLFIDKRQLSLTQILRLAREIATVIDDLHRHHLIHRDINPSNILIDQHHGTAYLIDFGVAYHTRDTDQFHRHVRVGTPGYIAPEQQLAYAAPTHLVDIFSFGVVLYEAFTGQRPWPGSVTSDIPSITQSDVIGIPAELDSVFAKLLAHEPTQRYHRATLAVDDIEALLQPHIAETQIEVAATPARHVTMHPVETALTIDLDHAVLHECQQHATQQQDPNVIRDALNQWGKQYPYRTQLLGRRSEIIHTQSQQLYFYELYLVQETRMPPQTVRVSPLDEHFSVDTEPPPTDYWLITIPEQTPSTYPTSGSTVVPGSRRVISCTHCTQGTVMCQTCAGTTQITKPDDPATYDICHACQGQGSIVCRECLGNGNIRYQDVLQWQRQRIHLSSQDTGGYADPAWIRMHCKPRTIYRMQSTRQGRPEWELVPALAQLIQQAGQYHGTDNRIVTTEAVIQLLPITEFIFEDGSHASWQWPWRRSPHGREPLTHRWALIGFENLLPPNSQWLEWSLIWICSLIGFCTILMLVLLF